MAHTGSSFRVGNARNQRREVALDLIAQAAGHGDALALEQARAASSGNHLRAAPVRDQSAEVSPTSDVPAAGHGSAIAPEQDCLATASSSCARVTTATRAGRSH